MAIITFKGQPIHTAGDLPKPGSQAPAFKLTNADLVEVGLEAFKGKKKILNISPSLDTGICATSAQRFSQEVSKMTDVVLLHISADLPFAARRFCESHSLTNVVTLSTFRSPEFGKRYGVTIMEGPLAGLMSRAVLVLDTSDRVLYAQPVPEITQEPDYDAALAAARR